jgi:hypothetical protein
MERTPVELDCLFEIELIEVEVCLKCFILAEDAVLASSEGTSGVGPAKHRPN